VPWCIVAGWSIELFLGTPTRPHGDIELEVPRDDYPRVRDHLAQTLELHAVGSGRIGPDDVHAPDQHQTWGLDVAAGAWRVDVMLVPGDRDTWVYRRDESLTAPRRWMVSETADGIPYLRPHGALLYKG